MRRALAAALVAAALAVSAPALAGSLTTSRYDREIHAAASRWMIGVPWKYWKAQIFQESRFDPNAVSPVGARGLAQIMPGTWREISRALRWKAVTPDMAGPAIEGGAWYMGRQLAFWRAPRPDIDRLRLAQASYNAGAGNLAKAQRLCGGRNLYCEIVACLPRVTGRYSAETITYVRRIARWYSALVAS